MRKVPVLAYQSKVSHNIRFSRESLYMMHSRSYYRVHKYFAHNNIERVLWASYYTVPRRLMLLILIIGHYYFRRFR